MWPAGNVVETAEVEKLSCAPKDGFIMMASVLNPELKTFIADARYVEEKKSNYKAPLLDGLDLFKAFSNFQSLFPFL